MIRHIVLTKFKSEIDEDNISEIYAGLSALTDTLSGANNFTGGRSESPEQMERGYMHGFVIDFDTWSDLRTYAVHPKHQALGAKLVDNAVGELMASLFWTWKCKPRNTAIKVRKADKPSHGFNQTKGFFSRNRHSHLIRSIITKGTRSAFPKNTETINFANRQSFCIRFYRTNLR